MHFTKMQGLGNDYLYVYGEVPDNIEELSIRLSNRYFGPGADGMIYICHSDKADYKMRIFNADGSEAKMCGNGIRCVGKYVYDKGYTDKTILLIDTLSGIKVLDMKVKDGKVEEVTVDMGKGIAGETGNVPVYADPETQNLFLGTSAGGDAAGSFAPEYTPVSTGNPHAVFFVTDMEQLPLGAIGPQVEKNPVFPDGVNAEFVQVLKEDELRMRVWERGSGITMACGTGTCASVFAAIRRGYCKKETPVTVHLDGGDLTILVKEDDTIFMTGPASFVYEGDVEV